MKRLIDFINEQLDNQLFESTFKDSPTHNWEHNGKYDYAIKLISGLLGNDDSVVISINNSPVHIEFSDEDRQRLVDMLTKLYDTNNNDKPTYLDFNKILKNYNVQFQDFDKHHFTTGSTSQSYSEAAEYLVTYLFNLGEDTLRKMKVDPEYYGKDANIDIILGDIKDKEDIKAAIKEWEDTNNRNAISMKESPYLASSIKSALLAYELLKEINAKDNYIAIQVNGDQLKHDKYYGDETLKNTASCFASLKTIKEICNDYMHCKELFNGGSNKDIWNKADILLVSNKGGLYDLKNMLKKDFENDMSVSKAELNKADKIFKDDNDNDIVMTKYNNAINQCIIQKNVIPISLKLIPLASYGSVEKEGTLDDETKAETKIEQITNDDEVVFQLPEKVDKELPTASVYLKAKHMLQNRQPVTYILQFRSQTGKTGVNNLSINASIQFAGANSMRMGKGISAIKNKIGAKKNEYYININNNQKLADLINKISAENIGVKDIEKIKDQEIFKLYDRPAIKGFFGVLDKLIQGGVVDIKSSISKEDLVTAFNIIYKLSTVNDSQYKSQWWLIM